MAQNDPNAQAAAAAAVNNDIQLATLAEHERIIRSTRIPLFYGNPAKDVKALDWINWFENAAGIGHWDTDKKKILEFYSLIRDDARRWYDHMIKLPGLEVDKWATIRKRFLENYDMKSTAKTVCYNFQNLIQRPRERVTEFYTRVSEVFSKLKDLYPERFQTHRVENCDDAWTEKVLDGKKEGLSDMSEFFLTQLFLAGMHEKLRTKIQESGLVGLLEIYDKANELEKLEIDHKSNTPKIAGIAAGPTIAAVREEIPAPNGPSEDLDEDELAAINAIRRAKGKPTFSGNQNGAKKKPKCRYCQKLGHMQKECYSRKRDNAPMVGEDGKPYQPRGSPQQSKPNNFAVKAVRQEEEDDEPDVVGYVNSVRIQAPPTVSLNW